MRLWTLTLLLVTLDFPPSHSTLLKNFSTASSQYLQELECSDRSAMEPKSPSWTENRLSTVKGIFRNVDYELCSAVCGTYCCQALVINTFFVFLSNLSQWIQKALNIDTSSVLGGRIAGLLTVTLGSYVSYKFSEFLVDKILSLFKGNATAIKLRMAIAPGKANLACINAPLLLFYKVSKYLNNQIPLNLGSLDIRIKNEVLGSEEDPSLSENVHISVKRNQVSRNRFKRELAVISAYGLGSFLLLGGRLHSFTPSELSHPGAFSMPNLSLEAQGYNYATKSQKRVIQMLGRKYGCHTCGLISDTERYIADHQPPSGVVKRRLSGKYISFLLRNRIIPVGLVKPKQYFYPQCNKCSLKQSNAVASNRRESVTHYGRLRPYHLSPTSFFLSRVVLDTRWSKLSRKVK